MAIHSYRTGPLVAASVLMVLFGGLTAFGSGCMGTLTFQPDLIKLPGPMAEEQLFQLDERVVKEIPSYPIVEGGSYVGSTLLGLAIIAAGIGVFMLSERARVLGIWLCLAELALELAHSAYNGIVIIPLQARLDAEEMPMDGDLSVLSWGALGVGIVIALAIWLTMIALLCSANVRAACNGEMERASRRHWDDEWEDEEFLR